VWHTLWKLILSACHGDTKSLLAGIIDMSSPEEKLSQVMWGFCLNVPLVGHVFQLTGTMASSFPTMALAHSAQRSCSSWCGACDDEGRNEAERDGRHSSNKIALHESCLACP